MAFAKKYEINFKQIKAYDAYDGWVIEIYVDGFAGSVTQLRTEQDSIVLSREAGMYDYINGTRLQFGLYNLTSGQYREFREASFGDYYCILKRSNGDVKFVGYNQSEIYNESYEQPPYSAKLEFTCGLNHLKYERFETGAGALISGQKTIIEVLRLCLNKLGYPLSIREFINLYENDISNGTTNSMLNQIYVRSDIYREVVDNVTRGFTCYRVIEELLKPFCSHIYINEGKWTIVRWQEYDLTTMYWREFLPRLGSESTVTVDSSGSITTNKRSVTGVNGASNELVMVGEDTEMSIIPPINRLRLTYNQNSDQIVDFDLLKNGNFQIRRVGDIVNYPNGTPESWTYTAITPANYTNNFSHNNKVYFEFPTITSNVANDARYISQTISNIFVGTSDNIRFNISSLFKMNLLQTNTNVNYYDIDNFLKFAAKVYIRFQLKVGTYYFNKTQSNYGTWTTTSTINTIEIPLNIVIQFFMAQNAINEEIIKQLFINHINTADLPISGFTDIELRIYQPYTNINTTTYSGFTMTMGNLGISDVSLVYLPDANAVITDYQLYQKIDEDEDVLEVDIIHGDGLYQFSPNSFRISSGTVTDEWDRRGKTDSINIFEMILLQFKELRGDFVRQLNVKLIGQFEPFNTIEYSVEEGGFLVTTNYAITSYSYNIETNEWDCELMEMSDFSVLTATQEPITIELTSEPPSQATNTTTTVYSNNNIIGNQTNIVFNETNLISYT